MIGLLAAGMGGAAFADEPMEDDAPAKPVEAHGAAAVIAPPPPPGAVPPPKPGPGPSLNLLTVAPEWPAKPYPVPPRKQRRYEPDYPREAFRVPEAPVYRDLPPYRRPDVYPAPPREPKPPLLTRERYDRAPPPPEDDRYEPQFEVVRPKGGRRDDYPVRPPYEARDAYRDPPGRYRAEPYAEEQAAPKRPYRAYGVSVGTPRYDPDVPLAPDFELNRHRGFGRLFPVLDPKNPSGRGLPAQGSTLKELRALGEALKEPGDPKDPVFESDMPAGFTFLALLVDHDLTLDLSTTLAKGVRGDEVVNSRTPELDLDNIYGAGPIATPYLYKLPYLRTGKLLAGEGAYVRHDVLRAERKDRPGPPGGAATAIIGDPRDDENMVISQLHAAFVSLHNRTVDVLVSRKYGRQRRKYCGSNVCSIYRVADALPAAAKAEIFETARDHVLHYYHRVIAEDLLPWMIGTERTADLFRRGRDFYFPRGFRDKDGRLRDPYIPVEFAAGAYRYGHSQVSSYYQLREGYQVNLFEAAGGGIAAFSPLTRKHLVDWRYFFDLDETPPPGFNWARRIDPLVTAALHKLNRAGAVGPKDQGSLPARNLQRGRVFYLPSGQAVAERILPVIEARGALPGPWQDFLLPPNERVRSFLGDEETPLWYYVLQEAEMFGGLHDVAYTPAYVRSYRGGERVSGGPYKTVAYASGPRRRGERYAEGGHSLGPVGGTIVGEVLVGLMEHYREKTGKGLAYDPEVRGSQTRYAGDERRGGGRPRYMMRNLLIDAGVVEPN